jgi:hypothetical protein
MTHSHFKALMWMLPLCPQVTSMRSARRFALAWNEIICTMREEDYLSNE